MFDSSECSVLLAFTVKALIDHAAFVNTTVFDEVWASVVKHRRRLNCQGKYDEIHRRGQSLKKLSVKA